MVTKPDQSTDEGDGVVQDNPNGTKKAAKTTRRSPRKKTATKWKSMTSNQKTQQIPQAL